MIHKLGNATQVLTGLNAMLSIDGGGDLLDKHAPDLSRCSFTLNELGWALATLGTAAGGELLMDRRDPRGLRILIGLVSDHSRRKPLGRIQPPGDLPLLTTAALSGWEVPWAICSLLLAASSECCDPGLEWNLTGESETGWTLTLPANAELATAAATVLMKIPGAEWELDAGCARLALPGSWLRTASA